MIAFAFHLGKNCRVKSCGLLRQVAAEEEEEENRKTGTTLVSQGRKCQGAFSSIQSSNAACGEPGALTTSSCPSVSHTGQCRYRTVSIKEPTSTAGEGEVRGKEKEKRDRGKEKNRQGSRLGSYPTLTWFVGKSSCLLRIREGNSTVQYEYVTRFMHHSASLSLPPCSLISRAREKEKAEKPHVEGQNLST